MSDILIRAGSFISIIILGILLRRIGFFKAEDFRILSRITLRITLPAAIISGFGGKTIDYSLFLLIALALGGGLLYIFIGYIVNMKNSKEQQSFEMLNLAGYNIGTFMLPFAQSFLGPMGVIATSIFDVGNSVICLGAGYGFAAMVKDGTGFNLKRIGKALISSPAFVCYAIMVFVNLSKIPVPQYVMSLAGIIGNANAFMAMLTIGVGFHLEWNSSQLGRLAKMLLIRYGVGAILSFLYYNFLPFPLEIRQTLALLALSPIGSAVPAFTGELEGDVGLSSAMNSIAIIISIVITVVMLGIML